MLALLAALAGGSLNLILSWLMQQLIDAASGVPGTLALRTLAKLSCGFLALYVALSLLKYASEPRFLARPMRQYKEFAFRKLMDKSVFSFRDESTAAYLSALTNDAGSIETDFLSQQLSVITKLVTFLGALGMMLWYSPLLTAVAAGLMLPAAGRAHPDRKPAAGGGGARLRPEPRLSGRLPGGQDLPGGKGDLPAVCRKQPRAGG